MTIDLPPPELLSFETTSQSIFHRQDDPRKKLQPDEIARAYAENSAAARREAIQFGITADAELRMQERIKDIFRGIADRVVLNRTIIQVPKASL